jgi:hypothetical protein
LLIERQHCIQAMRRRRATQAIQHPGVQISDVGKADGAIQKIVDIDFIGGI